MGARRGLVQVGTGQSATGPNGITGPDKSDPSERGARKHG